MSNIRKFSGVVSNFRHLSSTSGKVDTHNMFLGDPYVTGSINTSHRMSFRVDNVACGMNQIVNISNGDNVIVAGTNKGEFNVLAMNNRTTKMWYAVNNGSWFQIIGSGTISLVLLSIILSLYNADTAYNGYLLFEIIVFIFAFPFLHNCWSHCKRKRDVNKAKKLVLS